MNQLRKRVEQLESVVTPQKEARWIGLVDYGADATEKQRRAFEEGKAKAEAEGANVIIRSII